MLDHLPCTESGLSSYTATQSTSVLTVSPQSPLKPLHQTTHQNFHHLCINLVFFASIQRHHSHGSVLSSKSLWLRFVNSQSKGLTPALTLPFSVALSCQISGFRTLVISPAAPKSGQLCVFFSFRKINKNLLILLWWPLAKILLGSFFIINDYWGLWDVEYELFLPSKMESMP